MKRIFIALTAAVLCALIMASCTSPALQDTEPETTAPGTTVPETTEPETTEPETTEPETTEPETTEPETTMPETTEPETTEPETTVPETTAPETTVPETTAPETTVPETTAPETAPYENELGFKEDLSEYEKYMDPEDRDAYLLLVNPDHPLGSDYKPSDLTLLADRRGDRKDQLRLYAAKALEAFLKESRANGCKKMTSVSAYRPYNTQKYIFDNEVKGYMEDGMTEEEAIAKTRSDTAYPGESEHQSGLAVDVLDYDHTLSNFAGTYEAEWLAENCWKFGFILRYPQDKEEITTYVYEPWHLRYVGRYHAKRIYDMGMCLEEYVEYLANNP
ncbi:MAG: M15 family metallopeptidase [Clostridia bacterium]|nr:M15 family metallopeptidase [Clostridia bacterium]